jgi:hypothetical protein
LSTELKMVRYTARSKITLNEWTHVSVIRNSITGIIHVVIDNKVVDVFFSPMSSIRAVPILIGKNNTNTNNNTVVVKIKSTNATHLIPYNFTLVEEGTNLVIPYTLSTSITNVSRDWGATPLARVQAFNNPSNDITNYYVAPYQHNVFLHWAQGGYSIDDTFTLTLDDPTRKVKKVLIGWFESRHAVDVQIQVGGQTVEMFASAVLSEPFCTMEAVFDSTTSLGGNYFNGLLDHIEIYSKALTLNQIYSNYHASIENNLILHLDFENIDESNNVIDKSPSALVGNVLNPNNVIIVPITTPVVGEHSVDERAFKSFLSQNIQFTTDETHIIQGNTLNNMTIMAWVKPENLSAYDPIISKKGVFSFVLNSLGLPELRLGGNNEVDLIPLPIQSWMDMADYTPDPRDYTGSLYRFDDPTDLVSINQKDKEGEGIFLEVYGGASITTGKDSKSHGIRVNEDQYLQTTDTQTHLDLNAFTFGAWVKFDDTSKENQTILSMNGLQFTLNNGELSLIVSSQNPVPVPVTDGPGPGLRNVTFKFIEESTYGTPQFIIQNIALMTTDGTSIPYTVSLTGDWGDQAPIEAIFYKLSNSIADLFIVDYHLNNSVTYYKLGNEIVLTIDENFVMNQVVCSYHRARYSPTFDITYQSETIRVNRVITGASEAATQTAMF